MAKISLPKQHEIQLLLARRRYDFDEVKKYVHKIKKHEN